MGYQEYLYGSINLKISSEVYGILLSDCYTFNFIKNDNANLSGFLNDLIPKLSKHREYLHKMFLNYNNENEEITKIVENNLYNVYFKYYSLFESNSENLPFRINNKNRDYFIYINDVLLDLFDMDFTNYIRTLLNEYASKPFHQRELLYYYFELEKVKTAIGNSNFIKVYTTDNATFEFVPLTIEKLSFKNKNYICGIDGTKDNYVILPLMQISKISCLNKILSLTEQELSDCYDFFYDNLYKNQSSADDETDGTNS